MDSRRLQLVLGSSGPPAMAGGTHRNLLKKPVEQPHARPSDPWLTWSSPWSPDSPNLGPPIALLHMLVLFLQGAVPPPAPPPISDQTMSVSGPRPLSPSPGPEHYLHSPVSYMTCQLVALLDPGEKCLECQEEVSAFPREIGISGEVAIPHALHAALRPIPPMRVLQELTG